MRFYLNAHITMNILTRASFNQNRKMIFYALLLALQCTLSVCRDIHSSGFIKYDVDLSPVNNKTIVDDVLLLLRQATKDIQRPKRPRVVVSGSGFGSASGEGRKNCKDYKGLFKLKSLNQLL